MKRKKHLKPASFLLCCCLLVCSFAFTACSGSKKIAYNAADKGISKEDLIQTVDSKPKETRSEEGMELCSYDSTFLDYEGTMTYYFQEDKLVFSRWEKVAKDKEEGKNIYHAICQDNTDTYGEGTSEDSDTFSNAFWCVEGKNITVSYLEENGEIKVSIMEIANSNSESTDTKMEQTPSSTKNDTKDQKESTDK